MTKLKNCIQSAAGPTHIPDYRQILVEFTSEHTGSACLKRLVLAPVDLSTRQAIQELHVTAIVVYGLRIVWGQMQDAALSQRTGLCKYLVQAVFYSSILTPEKGACAELERHTPIPSRVAMGL